MGAGNPYFLLIVLCAVKIDFRLLRVKKKVGFSPKITAISNCLHNYGN